MQARKDMAREVKLLLLGAGESGKSTIAKQMRIIHTDGFSPEELESYRPVLSQNIVQNMAFILCAMPQLSPPVPMNSVASQRLAKEVVEFSEHVLDLQTLPDNIADAVNKLWVDPDVRAAYARRNEYQIGDAAAYQFDSIDRVRSPNFVPTQDDMLHCRIKTTGIIETHFNVQQLDIRMYDVGGQRSERKKWIHCFQDVTAIIFCASLSEYDQTLLEDDVTNRMQESLTLFKSICNSHWFANTAIILFLNKMDLFKEKIEKKPLTLCFPHYKGDQSFEETSSFIVETFLQQCEKPEKPIYHHLTCATDTGNVVLVFNCVCDIILQRSLTVIGLI